MSNDTFSTEEGRVLYKNPVLAWGITRLNISGDHGLYYTPIVAQVTLSPGDPPFDNSAPIHPGADVVGVVPAAEGTYKVYAPMGEHGDLEHLGYEYPRGSNPSWDKMIEEHQKEYNGEFDE